MEQITLMKYQSAIKKTAPESFYSEANGCLFKGDSLEILKRIRDASVDLIFADPPYSIKKLIGTRLKVKNNILNFPNNGLEKRAEF